MADWLAIEEWRRCRELAKPGIVFEIRNSEGQTMFSACTPQTPAKPFDWSSAPSLFRPVAEEPPERSNPLPPPRAS